MKNIYLLIGCLCVLAFTVVPAQAFAAKDLTIKISQNGDARIHMQYELSWPEQVAVFFRIADPAAELKNGLQNELHKPVTVHGVTSSSADVIIPSFAYVSQRGDSPALVTPSFTFARVQEAVNRYWFAKFLSPNFTPEMTTIIFPDGFRATFKDRVTIPTVAHRLK
jgi:hypothetical protein